MSDRELWLVFALWLVTLVGSLVLGDAGPVPPARADAATDSTAAPASSRILGLLPPGQEKRSFILDCTGCHLFDARIAFPGGEPRAEQEWEAAVERMLSFAGPTSGFPVIGPGRDPVRTAAWLAANVRRLPDPGSAPAPSAEIHEYDYPYPGDLPHDLIVDDRGQVLITGMFTHRIMILDPSTGAYDEEPIPVPDANPRALDIDENGDWWVLLGAPRKVARYRPAEDEWSSFDIGMYPHSIRSIGGRAWFNGHFTAGPPRAGYVDAVTGAVHTFELNASPAPESASPIPYGLRVAPDGTVWITELRGNRLVRLDPSSGRSEAYMLPLPTSGPRRPDIDRRGVVWIPLYAANRLARFDPSTEAFTEFELPLPDALPYVVRVDPRSGLVWIGTAAADALVSFDPARERFTVHPLPTVGAMVRHIDIDERTGDVWAAYGASPGIPPKIARLRGSLPPLPPRDPADAP